MSPQPPFQEYEEQNSFGKDENRIRIFVENLDEGLRYIQDHGFKNITLDTHKPKMKQIIDLSFLHNFKETTSLNISVPLSLKTDISPIYQLSELQELVTIRGFRLDLSHFPKLKQIHAYNLVDEVKSLEGLKSVTRLLFYPKSKDLSYLEPIKSLEYIRILQTQIESLKGIEQLPNLNELIIRSAPKLTNINHLVDSNSLTYFLLESAKNMTDFSQLSGNSSIQILNINTVENVHFIPHMTAIEELLCSHIKDGDLSPLLESQTLKAVDLYPQKRHYNLKISEINAILETKSR